MPSVFALLVAFAAAGCTSTDEAASAAVPSPDASTATFCRHLDRQLPRRVDDLSRVDPTPQSALTAGWGDPAIILRCGVPRPAQMDDPKERSVEVNGVDWIEEKNDDGSYRLTTTLRKAYVEVIIPEQRTARGLNPIIDLAPAVQKTIPHGIAG
nr:DUF3515 domain-containing protein [Streptomyces sp. ODS25]